MNKYIFSTILLVCTFLLYGQFSAREVSRSGDIPDLISFQGRLTDNVGNPLNSNIDIIFKIYDAETGGAAIWMEDRNVQVTDGLFQLNLGEDLPLNESYFVAETRWLGVTIAADAEMTPRIRITSTPYALNALETDPTWSGDADSSGDIGRTGSVGIGTATPGTKLHVNDGIFLTTGIYNSGPVLPVSVAQTRLFFYPRKGAFRAGRATGLQWDNDNIGSYSIAMGYNTEASGIYSTAMGGYVKAQGEYSTAFGAASEAIGNRSTAIGNTSKANGLFSTAIGDRNIATGQASTALGSQSRALGNYSFAVNLSSAEGPEVPTNTFRISGATNTIISEGNIGIGTTTPSQKLDVDGQVRIRGGSPGAGKVLTSNTDGVASWEEAATLMESDPTWSGAVDTTGDIGRTGNVGIGTGAPIERLHVEGANFLTTGTFGTGSELSVAGSGTKMFFYPLRGAFRAGRVTGNQWNDDSVNLNIGDYSTAMGFNTIANGSKSLAIGYQTEASGDTSVALGSSTIASGYYATAMGVSTIASGNRSTAMGNFSEANGLFSTAMGNYTVADGDYSTAMGSQTIASGNYATAMGVSTTASGYYSTAMGRYANALNNYAFAINLSSTEGPEVAANTFQISNAEKTIISEGKVGIGTATPIEKLHVEEANLLTTGTFGTSPELSVTGSGTRMFFYPRRGAFRAGRVTGNQWNDDGVNLNIGDYSVAMGYNTTASGIRSIAIGNASTAGGSESIALGWGSTASGSASTAIGVGSQAIENRTTAIGNTNIASGFSSTALGSYSRATGNYAVAFNLINTAGPDVPANTFQISNATNTIISHGNVGIGTDSPLEKLHIDEGIFLTRGTYGSGPELSVIGPGTRMFFYPRKAAFRAGRVTQEQWNDSNVGIYSTAMGSETLASGMNSTAMGATTTASGQNSTAMGILTTASGWGSTAMGAFTTANEYGSTAMGYSTEASGYLSTAMGVYSTASGDYSIAMGRYANALNNNAFAINLSGTEGPEVAANTFHISNAEKTIISEGKVGIGTDSPIEKLHVDEGILLHSGTYETGTQLTVSSSGSRMFFYPRKAAFRAGYAISDFWNNNNIGDYSTAMGYGPRASGYASCAIGNETTATGSISLALGTWSQASGDYSTAMGFWSKASGDHSFAINLSGYEGLEVAERNFRITGALQIGGNVAWTNHSDRRLKKDIYNLEEEDNLAKIIRLHGVRFRWKDNDKNLNLGFIAQDVEDIVPESVRYDEINDIYSMEYTALIPVLVEAIKEQQKQIDELMQMVRELQEISER